MLYNRGMPEHLQCVWDSAGEALHSRPQTMTSSNVSLMTVENTTSHMAQQTLSSAQLGWHLKCHMFLLGLFSWSVKHMVPVWPLLMVLSENTDWPCLYLPFGERKFVEKHIYIHSTVQRPKSNCFTFWSKFSLAFCIYGLFNASEINLWKQWFLWIWHPTYSTFTLVLSKDD